MGKMRISEIRSNKSNAHRTIIYTICSLKENQQSDICRNRDLSERKGGFISSDQKVFFFFLRFKTGVVAVDCDHPVVCV